MPRASAWLSSISQMTGRALPINWRLRNRFSPRLNEQVLVQKVFFDWYAGGYNAWSYHWPLQFIYRRCMQTTLCLLRFVYIQYCRWRINWNCMVLILLFFYCSWDWDVRWLRCCIQIHLWCPFLCNWRWRWERTYFGNSFARIFWCGCTTSQVTHPSFTMLLLWFCHCPYLKMEIFCVVLVETLLVNVHVHLFNCEFASSFLPGILWHIDCISSIPELMWLLYVLQEWRWEEKCSGKFGSCSSLPWWDCGWRVCFWPSIPFFKLMGWKPIAEGLHICKGFDLCSMSFVDIANVQTDAR